MVLANRRWLFYFESVDTVKHVLFRGESLMFDDIWLTEYEMNDGKAFLDPTL